MSDLAKIVFISSRFYIFISKKSCTIVTGESEYICLRKKFCIQNDKKNVSRIRLNCIKNNIRRNRINLISNSTIAFDYKWLVFEASNAFDDKREKIA